VLSVKGGEDRHPLQKKTSEQDEVVMVVHGCDGDTPPTGSWQEEFQHEPLNSVKLDLLKTQRSKEEVEKIARFLVQYKHILSDGTLDYSQNPAPHTT